MGGSWWPVRPLNRGMRLAIEAVASCDAEIGALEGCFRAVDVNWKDVPG